MTKLPPEILAGNKLRILIEENYPSQEEFAYQYGADVRTISRHINQGINKISTVQEYANHFHINFLDFFAEE